MSKNLETLIEKGTVFLKNEEYGMAEKYFKKAAKISPNNKGVLHNLGRVYLRSGEFSKGIEIYGKLMIIHPKFADGWYNLGLLYNGVGENLMGLHCFSVSLENSPNDYEAYLMIGMTYLKLKNTNLKLKNTSHIEEAEKNFQKAFELNPESDKVLFSLTVLSLLQSNFQKAEEYSKKGLKINPQDIKLKAHLCTALIFQGKLDECIKIANEILNIDKENQSTLEAIGRAFVLQEKFDLAFDYLIKALNLGQPNSHVLGDLGIIYYNKSDFENAKNHLFDSLQINAKNPKYLHFLGLTNLQLGENAKIHNYNKSSSEPNSNLSEGWKQLAFATGRSTNRKNVELYINEAEANFNSAVSLFDENYQSWFCLGIIYGNQTKYIKARKCYKKALEIKPDFYEAMNNLAILELNQENFLDAESYFKKLSEIDNKYTYVWIMLAMIYETLGKKKEEAACYDEISRLIKEDPEFITTNNLVLIQMVKLLPFTSLLYDENENNFNTGFKNDLKRLNNEIQEKDKKDPDAWLRLGHKKFESGNPKDGIKAYFGAMIKTLIGAGSVKFNEKKFEEAILHYQSAIDFDPDDAEPLMMIGMSYGNIGELDEAVDYLKKAIEINPEFG